MSLGLYMKACGLVSNVQNMPTDITPQFLQFYLCMCTATLRLLYILNFFPFFRTFVFPCLIRGGKPTPVLTFIAAFSFCVYNGYLQGCYHANYAKYKNQSLFDPRVSFGRYLSKPEV